RCASSSIAASGRCRSPTSTPTSACRAASSPIDFSTCSAAVPCVCRAPAASCAEEHRQLVDSMQPDHPSEAEMPLFESPLRPAGELKGAGEPIVATRGELAAALDATAKTIKSARIEGWAAVGVAVLAVVIALATRMALDPV